VKQCGRFLTDYEKKSTVPNMLQIRRLNESMLMGQKFNENMLKGFDQYEPRSPYGNNLTGILEFIHSKLGDSDLKYIVNADFVSRRNFLIKVAESAFTSMNATNDWGFACLCCKFDDICFIWELSAGKRNNSRPNGSSYVSQGVGKTSNGASVDQPRVMFMGKKFETFVTLRRGQVNANAEEIPSVRYDNNVVYRCQLGNNNKPLRIFYSTEEDCVDKNGNFVELTTCNMMNWRNELRYYLRALFTNQTRLVVGKCDGTYLKEVNEVKPTKLSTRGAQNAKSALDYLSKFLSDLKFNLNTVPEGSFFRVVREPRVREYTFQILTDEALFIYSKQVEEFIDLIAKPDL